MSAVVFSSFFSSCSIHCRAFLTVFDSSGIASVCAGQKDLANRPKSYPPSSRFVSFLFFLRTSRTILPSFFLSLGQFSLPFSFARTISYLSLSFRTISSFFSPLGQFHISPLLGQLPISLLSDNFLFPFSLGQLFPSFSLSLSDIFLFSLGQLFPPFLFLLDNFFSLFLSDIFLFFRTLFRSSTPSPPSPPPSRYFFFGGGGLMLLG